MEVKPKAEKPKLIWKAKYRRWFAQFDDMLCHPQAGNWAQALNRLNGRANEHLSR